MNDHSTFTSFTIEEFQKDDRRLTELLEISDEENQSTFVATIQLLPGSDVLAIEDMNGQLAWHDSNLSSEDFSMIEKLGLCGKLIASGCTNLGDGPSESRALIIGQQPIKELVDLPQPNRCSVIYYQAGDEWRKFPADAPVLKKRIRLSVDPSKQALFHLWVEDSFGSDYGGGGGLFNWANWPRA